MGVVAMLGAWLANPANLAMLIGWLESAVQAGTTLYADLQLKEMTDLLAALKANQAQLAADVKTMDDDIDGRDGKLEQDLNKETTNG